MKYGVTKTFDGDEWICFEEKDIIEACKREGCSNELRKECLDGFKDFDLDCISCYIQLISMNVNLEYHNVNRRSE